MISEIHGIKPVYTPNMLKILAMHSKSERPIIKEVISSLGSIISMLEQQTSRKPSAIQSRVFQATAHKSEEQKREPRQSIQENRKRTISQMSSAMKRANFPQTQNTPEPFLPEIRKSSTISNARRISAIPKYSTDEVPENTEEEEYLREQRLIDKEEDAFKRLEMERLSRYYKTKENTKRQTEKIRTQLNNISKLREEAKRKKEQDKNSIVEKRKFHQKFLHRQFEQDRERQQEINIQKQIVVEFISSEEIVFILQLYQKQIQYLFKHYSEQLKSISPSFRSDYTIDFQKCLKFLHDFQIVPHLLPSEESVRVFRQVARSVAVHSMETERGKQELQLEDFSKFLVHLALVLKNRIDEEGRKRRSSTLNLSCETYEADPSIVVNLFKYMRIYPEDKLAYLDIRIFSVCLFVFSLVL